jgi:hypothetical protein
LGTTAGDQHEIAIRVGGRRVPDGYGWLSMVKSEHPSGRPRPVTRLVRLPAEIVVRLEEKRAATKGETVMRSLGISDNSWRKIRSGAPIRASLAQRVWEASMALPDDRSPPRPDALD